MKPTTKQATKGKRPTFPTAANRLLKRPSEYPYGVRADGSPKAKPGRKPAPKLEPMLEQPAPVLEPAPALKVEPVLEPAPAPRMGRPTKGTPRPGDTLHVKLDAVLLDEIDEETAREAAAMRGHTVTRTSTIRVLLIEALDARKAKRGAGA